MEDASFGHPLGIFARIFSRIRSIPKAYYLRICNQLITRMADYSPIGHLFRSLACYFREPVSKGTISGGNKLSKSVSPADLITASTKSGKRIKNYEKKITKKRDIK